MAGDTTGGDRVRFDASLALQFIGLILAGALAWGNLKGDLRVLTATMEFKITDFETRIHSLEMSRDSQRRGR